MIRIAAVGDLHVGELDESIEAACEPLTREADVLLLAGDLTESGEVEQAERLTVMLAQLAIPVVAVLGNHDYDNDEQDQIAACLRAGGVTVLEGDGTTVDVGGIRLGIAGTKDLAVGLRALAQVTSASLSRRLLCALQKRLSQNLKRAICDLNTDLRIALLHFSPVRETLVGEPPEIYAFLGSRLLADAIDSAGSDMALHGHAHLCKFEGATPAGVPVRNVARSVIGAPYKLFYVGE